MIGNTCRPRMDRGRADVFAFGAGDATAQTVQNMMVMMTMPWAAMVALGSEMSREALSPRKD